MTRLRVNLGMYVIRPRFVDRIHGVIDMVGLGMECVRDLVLDVMRRYALERWATLENTTYSVDR